ncbi:MAG TPA: MBL fold metallo-hydrolase [Rhodocyclaceae bacterium]|nr:MBL fold metallo-hydrolase [Rhodocyclaceae bacterium]
MAQITDFSNGISAIDGGFGRPQLAAIHLLVEADRAALIDTGTYESVPRVLEALAERGLKPGQVDYVILTHIHLDHAGGAGLLMQRLPGAMLAVHPRGARHMADPSKLVAGTVAVYGEAATRRMYGDIVPVDAQRIVETADGSVLRLAGRELLFLDTPGHARHHVCIVDRGSGHVFAGDTFGLSYRELDRDGRQFVFPTTTPVQFDPQALHRSIERLLAFGPGAIYVTHYSQVREVPRLAADLHRLIDAHVELALREKDAGEARLKRLEVGIEAILLEEARRHDWRIGRERLLALMAMDIGLNAQGLDVWLDSGKSA